MLDELKKWLRPKDDQLDWLWGVGLLVAALVLYTLNLGNLPLRDWDEGTIAQVAKEIWLAGPDSSTWLHPTLWGEPYLNKPPLIHWLIAAAYTLGGVNEWTSRLPSALLTACSVPLLYGVGREIFHRRTAAVFSALVYLTMLPVVRHGRLAMLDGAILCFFIAMMWCLLRSRRNLRYALGVGIALSLICLTKGVMLGFLLGAIAILFLVWDTPRLLITPALWLGILLGGVPVALWYGAQWLYYGTSFLQSNVVNQSLSRIWESVEANTGAPWFYLLEVVKYGFPWLIFLPLALRDAWQNRNLNWAKLVLVWSGVYFITVSLMATKLPWYILPLYPALALAIGRFLTDLWDHGHREGLTELPVSYSAIWVGIFGGLALIAWAGVVYFGQFSPQPEPDLQLVMAGIGVTLTAVTLLIARDDPQFLLILIWGTYISLCLLMMSSHWVWELAEAHPVQPVAQLVREGTPPGQTIYTSNPINRPSLSFYSDRLVQPASSERMVRLWQRRRAPFLLLDEAALQTLNLENSVILGRIEGWMLVTRSDAEE